MTTNLDELRAAASKVLAEEAHEFGWHAGTEATTYGTLSHVYTPDRMTDLEAHRIIATNMSDTDAQYLASLHPARLLALLSRLEQAEQAVHRVREMHERIPVLVNDRWEIDHCKFCYEQDFSSDDAVWPCPTIRALDGEPNE